MKYWFPLVYRTLNCIQDSHFHDDFWSSLNSGISFRYRWNMISACIQNTNLARNSAKSVKKSTICNKKAPISSPFHVLQAGGFYKMNQLFVQVNTLFHGSFTQNHTFYHFKTSVLLGETKKLKDLKSLLKQYCFELYLVSKNLLKGKTL